MKVYKKQSLTFGSGGQLCLSAIVYWFIEQSYLFHRVGTKERIASHCVKAGKAK